MDIWQAMLFFVALVTLAINYNQRRVWLWIAVGAADFVLTDLYQQHPVWLLPHPFVTGITDALVVGLIIEFGAFRWERWVRLAFIASVCVSISRLAGLIDTRYAYVTLLEVCNYCALMVMMGTGITRLADVGLDHRAMGQTPRNSARAVIHRARAFLYAPRRREETLARAHAHR